MNAARIAAVVVLSCSAIACTPKPPAQTAASSTTELNNPASSSDGARVYITNCSSCHQLDGKGLPGAFPPLAANPVVTGEARRVIAIVKFGLREPQAHSSLTGVMPPWQGLLSDADIAAVVTYIRFAWHNRASAVTLGEVESVSPVNRHEVR
jgi:mono/diheme cytochrome c family protein